LKKFIKLYFLVFAAYLLITIAANNVLLVGVFKLLNEPVNPLIVNAYTIICLLVGIPAAAGIAFAFNEADPTDTKLRFYYAIVIVAHIFLLFWFFPIDKPSSSYSDDVKIIIHN
jgi:uncharacterized membrane protein YuzA (DUF378 family)